MVPALLLCSTMQGLTRSEAHVLSMLQTCAAAKSLVSDRNSTPSVLLHRTESLLQELSVTSGKAAVVSRFVRDYQLDSADAEIISAGDVDESFFSALERVHRVHENCRALLHTHHQRAGLELLDSMASYEETAYERLCKCALCSTTSNVHSIQLLVAKHHCAQAEVGVVPLHGMGPMFAGGSNRNARPSLMSMWQRCIPC